MERLLYSHTRVHTSYIYTYVAQVKILILIQDIILKSVDCQPHPISIWRRSQAFQPICHQSLSLSLSPDLSLTIENKIGLDRIENRIRERTEKRENVGMLSGERSIVRGVVRLLLVSWCNKREITWKLGANYKKCVCKRTNLRKWLDGSLNSLVSRISLISKYESFFYHENVISIKRVFRW